MDVDGVDIEVLYCEVSAYRYLYLLPTGAAEATRAFNDTLHDFASADPARLVVTYQVPIHDIDARGRRDRACRRDGRQVAAAPRVPRRARSTRLLPRALRPHVGRHPASGLPVCCHIGLNTALDQLADRDPTPRLAWMLSCMPLSACEALGMWLLTGILTRFPELKIVFVEPGLGVGRGVRVIPRRHGVASGLRVPGARRRAAELLLPPQPGHDLHRRTRSGAQPPPRPRRART